MKWFAITYVYQIICGEGKHAPQMNEQVRLIRADGKKNALAKAIENAESYNTAFSNCEGKTVVWKFVGITSVEEINHPAEGVQITSKIVEPASFDEYFDMLNHRIKLLTQIN
ncbi:DUF4288 domain-containing protein [Pedobacter sp. MW01-1-1]|uniref:DUF4288 domain-containing protein n=1 Tax=Pedobacter sp. MW01-1-1 TaxID=3383027 RepID=UPI003FEEBED8